MQKKIVLIASLFISLSSWSQDFIKTATPCDDELLRNTPGRWIHWGDPLYAKMAKQQQQEMFNRLEKIHQMVFPLFSSPFGIDVAWGRSSSDENFAQQIKIDQYPDGSDRENFVNGTPVINYAYGAEFHPHFCIRGEYRMLRGYPSEEYAMVEARANHLNGFFISQSDYLGFSDMLVDGRKIMPMPPVKGKWKGYTLYIPEAGSSLTIVLLHRDGMLPYIPVTRKQYLNLSIIHLTKMYDKWLEDFDKSAKAWGIKPDQSEKDKIEKQKKDILKFYGDELAATTDAGLLNTTAIVSAGLCQPGNGNTIFISEEAGGRMLVTENPAYIRKDLPKYIPQLFVLTFKPFNWTFIPKEDPMKIMEEKFPIEKLQEMIDK